MLLGPTPLDSFCFLGRDTGFCRNPLCSDPLFSFPDECKTFGTHVSLAATEQLALKNPAATWPQGLQDSLAQFIKDTLSLKSLLAPLVLLGRFSGDFQEGKRPIKAFGETAH